MISFLSELRTRNEVLFYFGALCLLLTTVCLLLTRVTTTQVLGINAYIKPLKFFLSTAIFVWTMGWYGAYLPQQRLVLVYSWALVLFFTIEDAYILVQAAKGQTSHFNLTTPYNRAMWNAMLVCALGITFGTAIVGWRFFSTPLPQLPPAYLTAIRVGFVLFFVFTLEGMVMGGKGAHTVGAPDGSAGLALTNWSKTYGDLRIAHFLGMHALQILPLLACYVFQGSLSIWLVSALYTLLTCWSLVAALAGRPLWQG